MSFDYFYGEQSDQFVFYRTPKVFYTDKRFQCLSRDARTLYGILLDRVALSAKNGWRDEQGRVYIYFTLSSAMDALGITDKTATKLFVELEEFGLIERKRQGQGKPICIYVKNFIDSEMLRFQSQNSYESGVGKSTSQESEGLRCNNNENSYTNISNTNPFLSKGEEERRDYISYFSDTLQIKWLKETNPYDADMIDEIFELIIDTVCSNRQTIRIAGDDKPINVVKSRFMKLDSGHIQFVLDGMKENTTLIRSMKQYLLAALYNAPLTISNYYSSLVKHDMATGKI